MTKTVLEAVRISSAAATRLTSKSSLKLGKSAIREAVDPIRSSIIAANKIIGFGDYHCDNEFRLFTAQMMPPLKEMGYERLCLEFPQEGQEDLDEGLRLLKKGRISFEKFALRITSIGGVTSWDHTSYSQSLFAAVIVSAYMNGIEVVGMDKRGFKLEERNDIWERKILESEKPTIVVGGAAHFGEPNSQANIDAPEWDDDRLGVDGRIKRTRPDLKVTTFVTRKPQIQYGESFAERGHFQISKDSEDYHYVTLPSLSGGELRETLDECLGMYHTTRTKLLLLP